jgi:hypothetical protein
MLLSLIQRLGIAAFALCTALAAPTAQAIEVTGVIGVDAWHVPSTSPARYAPNYSTAKDWRSTSAWASATARHTEQTSVGGITITATGRSHQLEGERIDRLDVGLLADNGLGVRVGILPYRVSWCNPLGEGPWMLEPDAYCRFHGLREVAQGAFGAQAHATTIAGGWLIDGMAGAYRPNVDGQDDKLGPYVAVGPTVLHRKHGISANAMHLASGLQLRAGWLHTQQHQDSSTGGFQRQMAYAMGYLAADMPVATATTIRLSVNTNQGKQGNPAGPYQWRGQSTTVEAHHKPAPGHTIALAWSRYRNDTTYPAAPNGQFVDVPSWSIAWRTDWQNGWATTVQATQTQDTSATRRGVLTERSSAAFGLRTMRMF